MSIRPPNDAHKRALTTLLDFVAFESGTTIDYTTSLSSRIARQIGLAYADGIHEAEHMLVDFIIRHRSTGDVSLITKLKQLRREMRKRIEQVAEESRL